VAGFASDYRAIVTYLKDFMAVMKKMDDCGKLSVCVLKTG
jgi:hypothetical protein